MSNKNISWENIRGKKVKKNIAKKKNINFGNIEEKLTMIVDLELKKLNINENISFKYGSWIIK